MEKIDIACIIRKNLVRDGHGFVAGINVEQAVIDIDNKIKRIGKKYLAELDAELVRYPDNYSQRCIKDAIIGAKELLKRLT